MACAAGPAAWCADNGAPLCTQHRCTARHRAATPRAARPLEPTRAGAGAGAVQLAHHLVATRAGAGADQLARRLVATRAGAGAVRAPWLAAASPRRSGASSTPRRASAWPEDIGVILATVAATRGRALDTRGHRNQELDPVSDLRPY